VKLLSVGQLVAADTAARTMASSALNQLVDGDWGDADIIWSTCRPGRDAAVAGQKARPAGAVIVLRRRICR
jgi:hypothetical protein